MKKENNSIRCALCVRPTVQEHYEAEKRKADARAEFESEQAYLKTLSLLRCVAEHKSCIKCCCWWVTVKQSGRLGRSTFRRCRCC